MTELEFRQAVRRNYNSACGYCGVREEEVGSELELDHFQPRSAGGGDELENLVYCCTTCNRLKSDFWADDASNKRLLHPQRDDLNRHLRLESDGVFTAITETGIFHFQRLRLNRAPLIALRRARIANENLRQQLEEERNAKSLLIERLTVLDSELERMLEEIARISDE